MSEIHDEIDVGHALRLLQGDKPVACCPRDGEPLVFTFEQRGAEFHCIACGKWFGFLSPVPKDPTDELMERYAKIRALFDEGIRGPHEIP